MAGLSTLLVKGFKAEAAITKRRIVKFGASDTSALLSAAATDMHLGVSWDIDAAIGENCDVILAGIGEVEFGGAVTRGQKLTSDAVGRAIGAAPGAGVNVQVLGIAMVSGVLNDIGPVLIQPSVMQG